jgi:hypothetical protein
VAERIADEKGWRKTIQKFPLPRDLEDKNMYSGWNKPEIYLDPQFRQNVSGLALARKRMVQEGIDALKNDLETGKWDEKYGHYRNRGFFGAGFRFIKCLKQVE